MRVWSDADDHDGVSLSVCSDAMQPKETGPEDRNISNEDTAPHRIKFRDRHLCRIILVPLPTRLVFVLSILFTRSYLILIYFSSETFVILIGSTRRFELFAFLYKNTKYLIRVKRVKILAITPSEIRERNETGSQSLVYATAPQNQTIALLHVGL